MFRINGLDTIPAKTCGPSQEAFQTSLLIFNKPKWISDASVSICKICKSTFSQLRRKHHCRACGEIFCNKCCNQKVPLPQFGLETERVCNQCYPVASCVTMSHSTSFEFHLRSAAGLSDFCQKFPEAIVKLGGAHTLIFLSTKNNEKSAQILEHVASGLHVLSHHSILVNWLASLGALNSLRNIIKNQHHLSSLALNDALNALRTFVKSSDELKINAIKINCLPSLVSLTCHPDASISLVATSIICIIAESPRNHSQIVNHPGLLKSMLSQLSSSPDEQLIEHVLKTLLMLSTGSNEIKYSLSSEDTSFAKIIGQILKSKPKNEQITAYAASLVANLATFERNQLFLQSIIQILISKLSLLDLPTYVTTQLARAIANFSSFETHSTCLV